MKKMTIYILILAILTSLLSGCGTDPNYYRYSYTFFNAFDTVTQLIGYTKTKDEFDEYSKYLEERMMELHRLYDKYNDYEGINNIKTINDNAGISPIEVEQEIIDLINFSRELNENSSGKVNIAFGAVLEIWSRYRDDGLVDPENAELPPMDLLLAASKHTNINEIIVDEINKTVFLADPNMALDVGAVAKGYAVELIAHELIEKGFTSWIMSAGGNIRSTGKPMDNERERWGVGIQNPDREIFGEGDLDVIFVNDASVVSSGDYQRYYYVDDIRVHHIIDPETLMPASYYRAVNVVIEDSGLADFYSTEVYLLPYEESRALVDSVEGLEAIWVFPNGTIEMSDGFKAMAKSQGATSN